LLEYILLSKAIIAVASPHYFSRGWCLFEFACKLATSTDFSALGVAWKAFVNFGSRKDGFDASCAMVNGNLDRMSHNGYIIYIIDVYIDIYHIYIPHENTENGLIIIYPQSSHGISHRSAS